jgi:uncharacterized small protein (DUF1192 family)
MTIALELLTGGWNIIKMGFSALGRFLGSLNAQGVCGLIVSLILAYVSFHQWMEARHWHKQSDRYEALYTQEKAAFDRTVAAYKDAAQKQKADDDAKNQRTVLQQTAVSQEKSDELEARLAAARAEYERLRAAYQSHSGGPASAAVPGLPAPSGGPDEAADKDRLSDALTCTSQSIQLEELQKWVLGQHAIDPNAAIQPLAGAR